MGRINRLVLETLGEPMEDVFENWTNRHRIKSICQSVIPGSSTIIYAFSKDSKKNVS